MQTNLRQRNTRIFDIAAMDLMNTPNWMLLKTLHYAAVVVWLRSVINALTCGGQYEYVAQPQLSRY